MTDKEMEQEIVRRTGIPRLAVREILDSQVQILRECLIRQEEVVFRSLLRIRATMRAQSVLDPKTNTRITGNAIRLSVKPVRSFREELNKWTSTESS